MKLTRYTRDRSIVRVLWPLHNFVVRLIARYITKHKLWWNAEDAKRWEKLQ